MRQAKLLILTALAGGSRDGYGIIADVRQISGGQVRLRAGTLYTALDRLRADGLVGVDREEFVAGRLRRHYRLITAARNRRLADADHLATGADLSIGDAEREATAAVLGEHFAQGRLTLDEFLTRLDAAFAATTRRQMSRIINDLPSVTATQVTAPPRRR